eukprot:CAMPEP_0205818384 /NCGR_PEP_ID=MMETSP0206-20130828/291_1 /ASSEMBLY_ACC=CAM_ASM_000279 /TAXON_ID=36767 /ORGANISM="Euplotes focardii, Strain TN1" /LENGTH=134 /DNA_ID=CAMNT_0053110711 /DNA_START=267 /DNA_END=671 /DNA_ORIENTATION=+
MSSAQFGAMGSGMLKNLGKEMNEIFMLSPPKRQPQVQVRQLNCVGCQRAYAVPIQTMPGSVVACPSCQRHNQVPAAPLMPVVPMAQPILPAPVMAAPTKLLKCYSCESKMQYPANLGKGTQLACPSCKVLNAIP